MHTTCLCWVGFVSVRYFCYIFRVKQKQWHTSVRWTEVVEHVPITRVEAQQKQPDTFLPLQQTLSHSVDTLTAITVELLFNSSQRNLESSPSCFGVPFVFFSPLISSSARGEPKATRGLGTEGEVDSRGGKNQERGNNRWGWNKNNTCSTLLVSEDSELFSPQALKGSA